MHYVTIVRMKKAAYLLAQTDDTIAEVAHQVGIDDPNYFTKLFKKRWVCLQASSERMKIRI